MLLAVGRVRRALRPLECPHGPPRGRFPAVGRAPRVQICQAFAVAVQGFVGKQALVLVVERLSSIEGMALGLPGVPLKPEGILLEWGTQLVCQDFCSATSARERAGDDLVKCQA